MLLSYNLVFDKLALVFFTPEKVIIPSVTDVCSPKMSLFKCSQVKEMREREVKWPQTILRTAISL